MNDDVRNFLTSLAKIFNINLDISEENPYWIVKLDDHELDETEIARLRVCIGILEAKLS